MANRRQFLDISELRRVFSEPTVQSLLAGYDQVDLNALIGDALDAAEAALSEAELARDGQSARSNEIESRLAALEGLQMSVSSLNSRVTGLEQAQADFMGANRRLTGDIEELIVRIQ